AAGAQRRPGREGGAGEPIVHRARGPRRQAGGPDRPPRARPPPGARREGGEAVRRQRPDPPPPGRGDADRRHELAAAPAPRALPALLFLLLLGALAGIGTEIAHPGLVFPAVLGSLCLVLFLFASQTIPISGTGVLLIALALVLFAAEVKVHSFGLLTAGGITSMILGAMMLVDAPEAEMRVSLTTLLPAAAVVAVGATLLVRLVVAAQRRRPVTGAAGMVGERGVAETSLEPDGWVRVRGERWRAVAAAP